MASSPPESGGFLHLTIPTPPESTVTSPSVSSSSLPCARSHPLKPGTSKESSFIVYVDRKLLEISRRYEKRYNDGLEDQSISLENRGYESFGDVAKDLENVVDIVWVSGTRRDFYISLIFLL